MMVDQQRRLRLEDVAKEAGVSPATVSLALNNSPLVRPATRERILAVAERIGYSRNPTARRLATNRTDCLCVAFAASSADPFYWDVMRGIMETAERHGYRLSVSTPATRTIANSTDLPRLDPADVDGILALNWHDRYVIRHLQSFGLPCVLIDASGDHPDVHAVDNDDAGGAFLAVNHLLAAGHQRIGLVGTPLDAPFGRQVWQGYLRAMAQANRPIDPHLIVEGAFTVESGEEAGGRLLALATPPTAIFAANDEMALGVLRAAHQRGVGVPGEVAVVGMDDIPMAALADPPLSTVRIDRYGLGSQATEMLIALVNQRYTGPVKRTLPGELILRASSCPLPAGCV
jgi:DNA-binding LacI/PurR family transcriptional regulator